MDRGFVENENNKQTCLVIRLGESPRLFAVGKKKIKRKIQVQDLLARGLFIDAELHEIHKTPLARNTHECSRWK